MRRWKVVPGFPRYIASTDGLIKRIGGRILKQGDDWSGYPSVCLYNGSRSSGKTLKVSHLILLTFIGPCPEGMEGCHRDGNRENNRLTNLRWDTHSSNVLDAVGHGTHVPTQGHKNGRAKLTEWEALNIYDRCWAGESLKDLAEEYGLHPEYVRLIKNGKYWRHIRELII